MKLKKTLEGINSRITGAEERMSDLEDTVLEITITELNKEKRMKRIVVSLRDFWDNIKCTNIQIKGIPEEEKEKGTENIFEEILLSHLMLLCGRSSFERTWWQISKSSKDSLIHQRADSRSKNNPAPCRTKTTITESQTK